MRRKLHFFLIQYHHCKQRNDCLADKHAPEVAFDSENRDGIQDEQDTDGAGGEIQPERDTGEAESVQDTA